MTQIPNPDFPGESDADFEAAITHFSAPGRPGLVTGAGLGKYRILERIRSTHNGTIYKARDAMLDRLVSLKQLSPSLNDDPVACGEFKREAQLLARLSGRSRNVTHVYELIGDENGFFIAEEHVEGDWLETQISKRIFTHADAPQLLRHGCLALGALQMERVVHRDAWPGNWLVGANGRLILTNFATATREGDSLSPPFVHAKYVAPEILLEEPCDCRADLYTFGIILFEICVGRARLKRWCEQEMGSPKPREVDWRAWHVDLAKQLPSANELNPDVSEPLASLIREMTAKDIDDRAGSFQYVLKAVNKQLSVSKKDTKALEQTAPNILEIRRVGTKGSPQAGPAGGNSLAWLLPEDQSTTTTDISSATSRNKTPAPRIRKRPVQSATDPLARPRLVRSRHVTRTGDEPARRRLPQTPIVPPKPADVEKLPRIRPSAALAAVAAIIVIISCTFAGYHIWVAATDPGETHREIVGIIAAGEAAREDGQLETAAAKLREAKMLAETDPDLRNLFEEANRTMLLIDAEVSANKSDLKDAEASLDAAEMAGAPTHFVSEIRDLIRGRRDALRIQAESEALLRDNQFAQVEMALPDYRRNAERAGLDPDALDRKLNETRADREYRLMVGRANEAIKTKDFEAALISARDARQLKDTPESRRLMDRILEAKRQNDHRLRGDKAMMDGDFAAAEKEYRSGLDILPDEVVERKLRTATAGRLIIEANEALAAGELLACQRLLRNSMWQIHSSEARQMLTRLAPAFEAANMVRSADRAIADGDSEAAIRLLRTAIPRLPSPAREAAEVKLDRLGA